MDLQPLHPDDLPKSGMPFNPPGLGGVSSTAADPRTDEELSQAASAAEVIREKLNRIYKNEPDPAEEEREVLNIPHRSKHQQYMYELSISGKSFAQVQAAWHDYYAQLPDNEKQEVWNEFYSANAHFKPIKTTKEAADDSIDQPAPTITPPQKTFKTKHTFIGKFEKPEEPHALRSIEETKASIVNTVTSRRKVTTKQHAQSLLFGLSMGLMAVLIMMFGFFNERFIAPFMTPSRSISDASIIIDPSNTAVSNEPQIIIPKINVQIPVVYDVSTITEEDMQAGLERGVVHYPITPNPGENGNAVIFGHSANNILNKGDYKFAFVLLNRLEKDDIFYLDYGGTRYGYRVYERTIVDPTEVSVLYEKSKPATVTLITCDPPGTIRKRLVVVGEQISPDPIANTNSSVSQTSTPVPEELPSDPPSLWSRIWGQ